MVRDNIFLIELFENKNKIIQVKKKKMSNHFKIIITKHVLKIISTK